MSNKFNNNHDDIHVGNFIKNIITTDIAAKKYTTIITRFPPEPNGYLHIGHIKSICLNFGLAQEFNGYCNLRFDDTNPEKETIEYINSIINDITWLGFKWHKDIKYASDYFEQLYDFAIFFIKQGLAYVCDLTLDEIRAHRGSLTTVGTNSPYRNRLVEENLQLFADMQNGEYPDGSKTLRLKIDMHSANINLRDPVIYRIKKIHHIRTLDKWCIYPMYDYTHCISDALENITHSCCTLEFEDHRALYDWILGHLIQHKLITTHPRQIEFSRLELQYTVTSKRKLNQLVTDKLVTGFDDPRMPTIAALRRRGYNKEALMLFIKRCGISKSPNIVDIGLFESSVREVLEQKAPRVMAVLNPLKIIFTNFDASIDGRIIDLHPELTNFGNRCIKLEPEIYIEHDDFSANPDSKWQRLALGQEVRLRHSYIIKCHEVIYDNNNNITTLYCTIDKDTLGKNPINRKVRGVIHWVNIATSIKAEVRLYESLFTKEWPDKILGEYFTNFINHQSLKAVEAYIEPIISNATQEDCYQFERLGFFVADRYDFDKTQNQYIFNRTITLKGTWQKANNHAG